MGLLAGAVCPCRHSRCCSRAPLDGIVAAILATGVLGDGDDGSMTIATPTVEDAKSTYNCVR